MTQPAHQLTLHPVTPASVTALHDLTWYLMSSATHLRVIYSLSAEYIDRMHGALLVEPRSRVGRNSDQPSQVRVTPGVSGYMLTPFSAQQHLTKDEPLPDVIQCASIAQVLTELNRLLPDVPEVTARLDALPIMPVAPAQPDEMPLDQYPALVKVRERIAALMEAEDVTIEQLATRIVASDLFRGANGKRYPRLSSQSLRSVMGTRPLLWHRMGYWTAALSETKCRAILAALA